jgi:hypothetical protein
MIQARIAGRAASRRVILAGTDWPAGKNYKPANIVLPRSVNRAGT